MGDKIATLIFERIYYPELDFVEKLDDTNGVVREDSVPLC